MQPLLDDKPAIEYLEGQPYRKVSPKRTHAIVQSNLAGLLQRLAGSRGIAGTEWRFTLSAETQLVPDVAYVSYDRLRLLSDDDAEEPPFAPDIAGEVRSPSYRPALSAKKIRAYFRHGSLLVLDVDPQARVVYEHRPDGSVTVHSSGAGFASPSLPWLQFDVEELFLRLDLPR